jgi:hypothetical protein
MESIKNLKIAYFNMRSIRNKLSEIKIFIKNHRNHIDIIIATEVWIYSSEQKYYNVAGFTSVYNCRDINRGGGTAIFIKEGIKFNLIENIDSYNFTLIEIKCAQKPLFFAVNYKAPGENGTAFITHLDILLEKYNNVVLMTDANFNILDNCSETSDYINMLHSNGFDIINNLHPTRVTKDSSTLIDHVITDLTDHDFCIKLYDNPSFDHRIILTEIQQIEVKVNRMITRRYQKVNYQKLRDDLYHFFISHPCTSVKNLIDIVQTMKWINTKEKLVRVRSDSNWITQEILESMNRRNKIYKKWKRNQSSEVLRNEYMKLKKEIDKKCEKAKQDFMERQVTNAGNNTKKLWKVINEKLYNSDLGSINTVSKIIKEGQEIVNKDLIADEFNRYFCSIGEKIAANIMDSAEVNNVRIPPCSSTFFLSPTNEDEVASIIHKLKINSAPGEDGITVKDVKKIEPIINPILVELVNKCIETGQFPKELKESITIPILKGGATTNMNNYRPIALTSVIAKIFEKVINCRLKKYIEEHIKFDKNQFGFQQNASTEAAATELTTHVINELDKGNYVTSVFIDLQKAFDTVNHQILLSKLEEIGIRGLPLQLFESYLIGRKVATKIDDCISSKQTVRTGVPQGSVLGPTLYLLYIHDLQHYLPECSYKVFADDTCLLFSHQNPEALEEQMNEILIRFHNWLKRNKLAINVAKTKYMIFKNVNKQGIMLNIRIDQSYIEEVSSFKYLGLFIDNKLTWEKHITHIKKKIVPLLGKLKRMGVKFNKHVINFVYNAHILSHIRYCLIIWSSCPEYNRKKIDTLMKKSLKILHKKKQRMSSMLLFNETKQVNLQSLIFQDKAKYIFKILNGQMKSNHEIVRRNEVLARNTRQLNVIVLPRSRTSKHQNSTLPSAISVFNSLPQSITNLKNYKEFVSKLKIFVTDNQDLVI